MKAFVSRNPVTTFIVLTLGYQVGVVLLAHHLMNGSGDLHGHPMAHNVFRMRAFGPLFFAMAITLLQPVLLKVVEDGVKRRG